ncbi:MAG: ribonuclease H family protein [Bacteroidales bacterium]|nr:ribonuclease H family protein [Bacteroidales bacterium]MDD4602881.1 ribonuclease H family protein [Bacteroidales bacterium]
MAKSKFFVVWKGKHPGIYEGWEDCKKQVLGFTGALYKGFPTPELARSALNDDPRKYMEKGLNAPKRVVCLNPLIGEPNANSICVDAACSGNPGVLEYRGVDTRSGAELFRMGPFPEGTVNLGEFLGIVHALAYLKQRDIDWPVYSDSRTAIAWVRKKAINTNLTCTVKNQKLFDLVDRAVKWIRENNWPNKILKWETAYWGEIPADFGRK